MPRKKPPDDPNAPPVPKAPRQRKKKEPAGKANTDPIKLEAPVGYDGPQPMGMPHIQNGIPGHHIIMEGMPTGPDGMPLPYGHPHPDYYYQGGPPPSVSNPHYAPSPHQPLPPPQHQFVEPDIPQNSYMSPHQGAVMPPHPGTPQPQQPMLIRFRHMPMMAPPWPHPYPPFLEYRLNEMNRRLYQFYVTNVPLHDHQQWWDAFSHEFFDDDAKLTIIPLNDEYSDMPRKQYTLSRLLIPRYFRTLFDSGVKEMSYVMRSEGFECMSRSQPGACALECESVLIVTRHEKPVPAQVQTECRMLIEFAPFATAPHESSYRIKNWRIELKGCQEFISKDINVDNETQESLRHGITKSGLPHGALEYLKLCTILEPMQILMRESQTENLTPCGALKRILFNHYTKTHQQQPHLETPQPTMNPMGPMGPLNPPPMLPQPPVEEPTTKKPARKRVRNNAKNNAAGGGNAGGGASNAKKKNTNTNNTASPAPNGPNFSINPPSGVFPMHYGQNPAEVLIVGEPSMMGNEYGEEDERAISRIENTQYDPNMLQHGGPPGQPPHHNGPGMPMPMHSMPAPMPHRQCPPGFLGELDFSQSGGMPPAGLWPNSMPIGASPSSCAPHAPMPIGASGDM